MPSALDTLQNQQQMYATRNFGSRDAWQPLLSIINQYGEWWNAADTPEQNDALADMVLYANDFASALGLSSQQVFDAVDGFDIDLYLDRILGKLAGAYLLFVRFGHSSARDEVVKWLSVLLHELALSAGGDKAMFQLVADRWKAVSK